MSKWEVTVHKIESVRPYADEKTPDVILADKLEIARVAGWDICVGKGQYQKGDLTVYVPIESILPQDIIDTVFKDSKVQPHKGRIRAVKIRGLVSYGLALSPTILSGRKYGKKTLHLIDIKEGMDVAEALGIVKYEPPEPAFQRGTMQTSKKKKNPYFTEYSDIQNVKWFPNTFGENEGNVVITEKLHGTSVRYANLKKSNVHWWQRILNKFFGDYEYLIGSRHVQIQNFGKNKTSFYDKTIGTNPYLEIADKLKINTWLPKDYILYGEIIGKSIQDLEYGRTDRDFYAYDVKKVGADGVAKYLDYPDFVKFCDDYKIQRVPLLYIGAWNQDCLKFKEGKTTIGHDLNQIREGCVIKCEYDKHNVTVDDKKTVTGRVIVKAINDEYLTRDIKTATEFH